MVTRTADDETERVIGVGTVEEARYVEIELDHGEVIIFDREDETAWIQSQTASELGLVG